MRQYVAGTPINNTTTPVAEDFNPPGWPVDKAASAEAVILEFGGDYYILSVYYEIAAQRFYVDIYQWTTTGLVQVGAPQDITVTGPASFGWIRLDALNLEEFVITWEEGGRLYAKAGTASSGFTMGNTVQLDNSSIGIGAGAQPDVAMAQVPGDPLLTHFVYTDLPGSRLVVSRLRFNDILTAPPPAPNPALLSPVLEDLQSTSGNFDVPRIDAPDNYSKDDWSYVVKNNETALSQGYIFTGVMNSGSVSHFVLNNGSLGVGLPDVASTNPATPHINDYPVVAYDNTGENIYFVWYYFTTVILDQPYPGLADAYMGLKMDNTGNLFGLTPNKYWGAQFYTTEVSKMPTIALSTQNDASPELFMVFTKYTSLDGYAMGPKTIPWTNIEFRPEESGIKPIRNISNVQIAPNPFHDIFQFKADRTFEGQYSLFIYDLTGRKLFQVQGTIADINEQLSSGRLSHIQVGNYFVNLINSSDGQKQNFKLIKIK